jgi:hypothetical protein
MPTSLIREALVWYGLLLFLLLLGRKLLGHSILDFLGVYAVTPRCVHQNVVSVGPGSLIGRIQQADFQKQLAKFSLAYLSICFASGSCAESESFLTSTLCRFARAETWL